MSDQIDLFNYRRVPTHEVWVGGVPMGADNPIRVQTMTNVSTMDTEACVNQILRVAEAGGEYVRLTTQGVREAENLKEINIALRSRGCMTPLVADVHFNPKVADVALLYAEKVRINPGNYTEESRKGGEVTLTPEEYEAAVQRQEARFSAFVESCKQHGTAIRIGVNHGSLSERIMSRYGDTPRGMVESCMEFLRVCQRLQFPHVVISVKASNTVVMVQTVRQMVRAMEAEGMDFPIHLGVTEAGDGEDGRLKSALGIGTLLQDGIGDTIRVSLSEEPEAEIPVAKKIVAHIAPLADAPYIPGRPAEEFNFYAPTRRHTDSLAGIGGGQPPVVVAARLDGEEKDAETAHRPDFIYMGKHQPTTPTKGMKYLVDADVWEAREDIYPVFCKQQLPLLASVGEGVKFLFLTFMDTDEEVIACLKAHPEVVIIAQSNHPNRVGEMRALVHELMIEGLRNPVIFFQHYAEQDEESLQVKAAMDYGPLLIDGLCDGVFLYNQGTISPERQDEMAFGILQAARARIFKTEYISCPGCGRTLFNLLQTIAKVKAATPHLKGVKIGIMGCIVNGPGEMADADYGYVGAGPGKVNLYRGKECVKKGIPEAEAVDELLRLIEQEQPATHVQKAGK